jgi:hypothetical protein
MAILAGLVANTLVDSLKVGMAADAGQHSALCRTEGTILVAQSYQASDCILVAVVPSYTQLQT